MSNTLSNITAGVEGAGPDGVVVSGLSKSVMEPRSWLQDLNISLHIMFPALAGLFVLLRVLVRTQLRLMGWDDGFILLAMVNSIVLSVATVFAIKDNFVGIHYYDIPPGQDPTQGLIWLYVVGLLYNPVLAFVKQSVLLFILRIAGLNNIVRFIIWATTAFNMAEMCAVFLVVAFQCVPVQSFWHPELGQHCINQQAFAVITALLTILTDLVVVALPFYVFLSLQMSKKKKLALIFVFSLGLVVCIVSILRLYSLTVQFAYSATNPDVNFTIGPGIAAIECNLAIITACAPTLWPLLQRVRQYHSDTAHTTCPHCCRHHQQHHHHHKPSGGGGGGPASYYTYNTATKQSLVGAMEPRYAIVPIGVQSRDLLSMGRSEMRSVASRTTLVASPVLVKREATPKLSPELEKGKGSVVEVQEVAPETVAREEVGRSSYSV